MGKLLKSLFIQRKLKKQGLVNSQSRKKNKKKELSKTSLATWLLSIVILVSAPLYNFHSNLKSGGFYSYVSGQTIKEEVVSRINFSYNDALKTKLVQNENASKVPPMFLINEEKTTQSVKNFKDFITEFKADNITNKTLMTLVNKLKKSQRQQLKSLFKSSRQHTVFLETYRKEIGKGVAKSVDEVSRFQNIQYGITKSKYDRTLMEKSQFRVPTSVAQIITSALAEKFVLDKETSQTLNKILAQIIIPNMQFNAEVTKTWKEKAISSTQPVVSKVSINDIILPRNVPLSRQDIERWEAYNNELKQLHLINTNAQYLEFSIHLLVIVVIMLVILSYLYQTQRSTAQVISIFVTTVTLNILLLVGINRGYLLVMDKFDLAWTHQSYLMIIAPVALASIILTILIDHHLGFISALLMSLILGLVSGSNFNIMLNVLICGSVASFAVKHTRNRFHIVRACFYVITVNLIFQFILRAFEQVPLQTYLNLTIIGLSSFLLLYFLVTIILPVLEYIFHETSNLTLLELCDLNHPLLQRLQMEAPGSYHHSLVVATISEHAAKAIGANPLLTRVCAYFHDIGKIAKSEYFTENNYDSKAKHNDLKPKMSNLVIQNHVKEGVNLALRYKLKKPILEAIEQHHGKSLVSYFYHIAKQNNDGTEKIDDSEFRYPGPLPRRKEIVVLAIADPCEAASRSLEKPSLSNIEALVNSIIRERVNDGMFADAEITLQELEIIKNSIVKTLSNMLHSRIAYPKEEKNESESS